MRLSNSATIIERVFSTATITVYYATIFERNCTKFATIIDIFFRKQFTMVNDSLGTGSLGTVYFCPENLLENLKL